MDLNQFIVDGTGKSKPDGRRNNSGKKKDEKDKKRPLTVGVTRGNYSALINKYKPLIIAEDLMLKAKQTQP